MNASLHRRLTLALSAGVCTLAAAHGAHAADCSSLPSPVYVTGSSAVKPFLAKLGAALSGGASPITIVYKGQGSCTGVAAIVEGTAITGTATYWTPDASGDQTCDLSLTGDAADVGVSDVFATSCNLTPGADVADFFGPVQVMSFVVAKASTQASISAEAAYLIFGLGSQGMVAPWTDDLQLFRRNESSGTQQMIAKAIGVPANQWKGVDSGKSSDVLTKVSTSVDPEKAIGILASDLADDSRDKIKLLAYQHTGQTCGFLPDSTPNSFDKQNVRDGHYPIWGPLHMLAKVDGAKKPTSAGAATVIGYLSGELPAPDGVDLLGIEIAAHTIPSCAMRVTRSDELGALSSLAPAAPCGCFFDAKATGQTTCATCTDDAGCTGSATHCRYGYCEAYLWQSSSLVRPSSRPRSRSPRRSSSPAPPAATTTPPRRPRARDLAARPAAAPQGPAARPAAAPLAPAAAARAAAAATPRAAAAATLRAAAAARAAAPQAPARQAPRTAPRASQAASAAPPRSHRTSSTGAPTPSARRSTTPPAPRSSRTGSCPRSS
jgi:ABC-type phosphate transport system substrate-binding protein